MKDIGDEAFCHGLTRNVLCFWVHQPRLDIKPGFQWAHVGTHFDPNITWWDMSHAWLTYLARCQYMLRQGLFVADFAYLQSEEVPSFIAPRGKQQPARPAGFDYDVLNAEVLLSRATAKDGRLVLPDGMSYRYLVLPDGSTRSASLSVLRKLKALTERGVTLVGNRPTQAVGLANYPQCDEDVKNAAGALGDRKTRSRASAKSAAAALSGDARLGEVVRADGLPPDVEFRQPSPKSRFDWIHRQAGPADIYFLANLASVPATAEVVSRAAGRQPELWDAVTGQIRDLPQWHVENGRTLIALTFAPRQSWFVVFRKGARGRRPEVGTTDWPAFKPVQEITGPWEVSFDPKWGGPKQVTFQKLDDWITRPEEGIRYYSGKAVYRSQCTLPAIAPGQRMFLDLGRVKNIAQVRLNGRDVGVVWTAPGTWRSPARFGRA